MEALFVNDNPELVGTSSEITKRINEVLEKDSSADINRQAAENCGSCGSSYFYPSEALCCPCHDYYA